MKLLSIFRKKEEEKELIEARSPEQELSISHVIRRHETRISNLKDEMEILSKTLKAIELDIEIPRAVKLKKSDTTIRRMTLIKYEIDIREDLLKWL